MKPKLIGFFKKTALELAKQSKCVSHKVGCLIIKDERIISMGYNGTPPSYHNCNDVFDQDNFCREEHHKWSLKHETHAELNALMHAVKNGISTDGAIMLCTLEPCNNCVKTIIQSGIKTIYYIKKYDKSESYDAKFSKLIDIKQI